MYRLCLSAFVAVALGVFAHSAPPAAPAEAVVRARLTGSWHELVPNVPRAKQPAPYDGMTWDLFMPLDKTAPANRAYLTDWDNEAGQHVGELYLNTKADPMWLDFKYQDAGTERVWVGIVRFEGKNVRWVRSSAALDPKKWADAKGNVQERPTAFADKAGKPLGYILEPIEKRK